MQIGINQMPNPNNDEKCDKVNKRIEKLNNTIVVFNLQVNAGTTNQIGQMRTQKGIINIGIFQPRSSVIYKLSAQT